MNRNARLFMRDNVQNFNFCIQLNHIYIYIYVHIHTHTHMYYITKASCQAWLKLLFANEVRIGGPGGGRFKTDHFEALPQLHRVASVVDFEADVPGGNWVTVGFDSPLVRLVTCIGGTEKRALVEGEMKQEWSLTWSTSAASALQLLCKLLLSRTIAPFLFISIL